LACRCARQHTDKHHYRILSEHRWRLKSRSAPPLGMMLLALRSKINAMYVTGSRSMADTDKQGRWAVLQVVASFIHYTKKIQVYDN
jgi:hypothetical protein